MLLWEERRQGGEDLSAEELCRNCPEQLDEVRRRLAALRAVYEAMETPGTVSGGPPLSTAVSKASPPPRPRHAGAAGYPTIPGYEILGVLGRGGMGMVYQARQCSLNRLVALKMIRTGDDAGEEELARFRTEAEAVARLHHPNIVQIHEVGESEGKPYFSLEFVEGGNLADQVQSALLPPAKAARLAEVLARAMDHAHAHGIVHRDLKPHNVLLTADGTPKVTDFGLAKRLDAEGAQTPSGAVMGTPSYMAPEQAAGDSQRIGPAADVYALGALLYEVLTGRPPFKAATPMETVLQVLTEEPVPPRRLQPRLPRDLETICLKCLHKQPHRRYASALDLAEDLRRFQAGEPIQARPVGRWERLVKWARRRPAAAALAVVSTVTLVVLAVLGLSLYGAELQSARHQARLAEKKAAEVERLGRQRAEAQRMLSAGQAAFRAGDWAGARRHLDRALAGVGPEAALRQLGDQVKDWLTRVDAWEKFQRLRDEALFFNTHLTGADRDGNLKKTRAAARQALQLFGVAPETAIAPRLRQAHFSARDLHELTDAAYELLLIWAEAEAQPLPGESSSRQTATALRLLAQAKSLRPPTQAYHQRLAQYLARSNDWAGAVRELWNAAQVSRTGAGAFDSFLLGDECYQRRDWGRAIEYFEQALRKEPRHFWAQWLLAVCHGNAQNPVEARFWLSACLQSRPNFGWIYLLRGFAEGEVGANALADGRLTKPERRDRADFHFQAAEADFQKAGKLLRGPDETYVLLVHRGVLRIRQNRLADAVGDLGRAIRLKPKRYHAYLHLAKAYELQGKPAAAVNPLDEAIRLEEKRASLYRTRARLQLKLNPPNRQAALQDLEKAIAREPAGSTSLALATDHTERGLLLAQAKRYAEAVRAFDAALQIRPRSARALRLRAEALMKLGKPREAITSLNSYLQRAVLRLEVYRQNGEPVGDVFRRRGLAHGTLGNCREALADYTRALDLDPNPDTFAFRGELYLLNGSPQLALEDFDEALNRDRKNVEAHTGRGYALVRLGQSARGVAAADRALKLQPRNARLVYKAARVYAQAAAMVLIERGEKNWPARKLGADYRDRALELIRTALRLCATPEARRRFWREYVKDDPALRPIRGSVGFTRLAQRQEA
jgi:tetratricopeptide (TPR) repeat protein